MCRDDIQLKFLSVQSLSNGENHGLPPNNLYLNAFPWTLRAGDKISFGIVNSLAYATGLLFLTTRCCSASYKNRFKCRIKIGGTFSTKTCLVASTLTPFEADQTPGMTSGSCKWCSASVSVCRLGAEMSSWRGWYGSSVMESFWPGVCRTERSLPPNRRDTAESFDSVYESEFSQMSCQQWHRSTHGSHHVYFLFLPHFQPSIAPGGTRTHRPADLPLVSILQGSVRLDAHPPIPTTGIPRLVPTLHIQKLFMHRLQQEPEKLFGILLVAAAHRVEPLVLLHGFVYECRDKRRARDLAALGALFLARRGLRSRCGCLARVGSGEFTQEDDAARGQRCSMSCFNVLTVPRSTVSVCPSRRWIACLAPPAIMRTEHNTPTLAESTAPSSAMPSRPSRIHSQNWQNTCYPY